MFAFAIYNKNNKTLFCARDNFGIKPFYYYKNDNVFIFSSEIKAILEHPKFQKLLNQKVIAPYLEFGFNPISETFFKNVYCLEPGTILKFQNNEITTEKYYNVDFKTDNNNFKQIVNRIEKVMEDSIKHHLISDTEIGAFLSSGIDSSYIVSVAKPNKTYTVDYDAKRYSEIEYAKQLTQKIGIKNISKKITKQEYVNSVQDSLYYLDEPLADPSATALYLMSKLAKEDVKVVISGEGADEFFGGYNTYKETLNYVFYNKIPFFIRNFLAKFCKRMPESRIRNFIVRRGLKLEDNYVGVNRIFQESEVRKVLNCNKILKINSITKETFESNKEKSDLIKMQAVDIKYWLVKDILLKSDKMTMANSIEARNPFIDKEVFKVASSLKDKYKISKENTKLALREAAKTKIPEQNYKKKKLGFPVPIREWLREDDLYNEIKQTINKEYVQQFFNQKYVLKLLEQHRKQKKDNYKKIWAIYCFIKWYEIYFLC